MLALSTPTELTEALIYYCYYQILINKSLKQVSIPNTSFTLQGCLEILLKNRVPPENKYFINEDIERGALVVWILQLANLQSANRQNNTTQEFSALSEKFVKFVTTIEKNSDPNHLHGLFGKLPNIIADNILQGRKILLESDQRIEKLISIYISKFYKNTYHCASKSIFKMPPTELPNNASTLVGSSYERLFQEILFFYHSGMPSDQIWDTNYHSLRAIRISKLNQFEISLLSEGLLVLLSHMIYEYLDNLDGAAEKVAPVAKADLNKYINQYHKIKLNDSQDLATFCERVLQILPLIKKDQSEREKTSKIKLYTSLLDLAWVDSRWVNPRIQQLSQMSQDYAQKLQVQEEWF